MSATALSLEGRVGAFNITGHVFIGDLEPDEVVELSKKLGLPPEQLHVDGKTLTRNPAAKPSTACPRTREAVLEEGSLACSFCGFSLFQHRLVREPVKIAGAGYRG